MKRTFVKISVFAVTFGVVLASCNNEAENAKLQEADDLAVQGLVTAKESSLDSAVAAEWNTKIITAADSILAAEAAKKHKAYVHHPAAKPVVKEEPVVAKVEEVKKPTKLDVGQQGSASSNTHKLDVGQQGSASSNTHKLNVGQKQ